MRVLQRLIVDGYLNVHEKIFFIYRSRVFVGEVDSCGYVNSVYDTLSKWVTNEISKEFHTKPRFSAWNNVRVMNTGVYMQQLRKPAELPSDAFERVVTSYFAPRLNGPTSTIGNGGGALTIPLQYLSDV